MEDKHQYQDPTYELALKNANSFNLKCLVVMIALSIIAFVLNIFGIFKIDMTVMIVVISLDVVLYGVPLIYYFIHNKIHKGHDILKENYLKILIIIMSFIGSTLLVVALSFQTTLVMVLPILMAAQYRNDKKMVITVFVLSIVMVPLAIYGNYFFGLADRNLLKVTGDDFDKYTSISSRFELATPKRMGELLLHYVMPRLISVLAIDALIIGIVNRNARMLKTQKELSLDVQNKMERINLMQTRVIEDLADIVETRDSETGEHIARTKKYVSIIANLIKDDPRFKDQLDEKTINEIVDAAPLHDIGKIAVSDTILLKPGRLTPEEFEKMKVHTTIGGEMILKIFKTLDDPLFLDEAHNIALYHHEKWNGTGYPKGLKENEIPLAARIMAIADVYDALTSVRVYKPAMSDEEAFAVLIKDAGTHFDPNIMDIIKDHQDLFSTSK